MERIPSLSMVTRRTPPCDTTRAIKASRRTTMAWTATMVTVAQTTLVMADGVKIINSYKKCLPSRVTCRWPPGTKGTRGGVGIWPHPVRLSKYREGSYSLQQSLCCHHWKLYRQSNRLRNRLILLQQCCIPRTRRYRHRCPCVSHQRSSHRPPLCTP